MKLIIYFSHRLHVLENFNGFLMLTYKSELKKQNKKKPKLNLQITHYKKIGLFAPDIFVANNKGLRC